MTDGRGVVHPFTPHLRSVQVSASYPLVIGLPNKKRDLSEGEVAFWGYLRHLESSDFHLPFPLAGVVDHDFEAFGDVIGDPVRAALGANRRRYVSHHDDAETEVNCKGGCARMFCPAAFGAGG